MAAWRVLKSCGNVAQRVGWQPSWILWTSKVPRRLTMLSTRWVTGTYALITMSPAQCPVLYEGWRTTLPLAVTPGTFRGSHGPRLVLFTGPPCPSTAERDAMNAE